MGGNYEGYGKPAQLQLDRLESHMNFTIHLMCKKNSIVVYTVIKQQRALKLNVYGPHPPKKSQGVECFHEKKRAEKIMLRNETPETTRIVPSLVEDEVGVRPVVDTPLDLLVTIDPVEEGFDVVIVGRPAKRTALVNV